jgi:hypothetical protein
MPRSLWNGAFVLLTVLSFSSALAAQTTGTHVLVIAVGGANLSNILDDPANRDFLRLMDEGTTAAATIVGHTTISDPSWTAVLTGVWSERRGVVDNVFTPWARNAPPTVFNQLELFDSNVETFAITDSQGVADAASAGAAPADVVVYIPQIRGDANWLMTDDAVGKQTVEVIASIGTADPTFVFTHFNGVEENGRRYGSDSPQYGTALRNVNENIGAIMAAVDSRGVHGRASAGDCPQSSTCEDWTIIVVTDHGHQPAPGGHGFKSPAETTTFVIAKGDDFAAGSINLQYEIVDVTPTVVTLFGGTPPALSDGVSLTTLGGSDAVPVDLHQALRDMIAIFGKLWLPGGR